MKRYLFDEIDVKYDGSVAFHTFRNLKFTEIFSTSKCGHATSNNHSEIRWTYYPKNFKQFLNCLVLTKTYDNEYIINCKNYDELIFGCKETKYSFTDVLKTFAKYVYQEKNATKEQILDFYEKAKKIKEATVTERALSEKNVGELIK